MASSKCYYIKLGSASNLNGATLYGILEDFAVECIEIYREPGGRRGAALVTFAQPIPLPTTVYSSSGEEFKLCARQENQDDFIDQCDLVERTFLQVGFLIDRIFN